jgi:hypothetical protein
MPRRIWVAGIAMNFDLRLKKWIAPKLLAHFVL